MSVDVVPGRGEQLRDRVVGPGDDAVGVHHLGKTDGVRLLSEEPRDVLGGDGRAAGLERARGDAGRDHHENVERNVAPSGEDRTHPVEAEHVRDLVRVHHDGRGSPRKGRPGELVDHQLRRLEVHVGVDESRDEDPAGHVDALLAFVAAAHAGDEAVRDRDVALEELAREDGQDAAAGQDQVGRPVTASDRDPRREHVAGSHGRRVPPVADEHAGVDRAPGYGRICWYSACRGATLVVP
jgi:hypothetical protein